MYMAPLMSEWRRSKFKFQSKIGYNNGSGCVRDVPVDLAVPPEWVPSDPFHASLNAHVRLDVSCSWSSRPWPLRWYRRHNSAKMRSTQTNARPVSQKYQDIPTKLLTLYSPSSPASNKPNSISISSLFQKLAYLAMLFILQLTHTDGVRQL